MVSTQLQNLTDKLLEERFFAAAQPEAATEVLLVRSPSLTVDDPRFGEFVEEIAGHISSLEPVSMGNHYFLSGDEFLVSLDRHSTYLMFTLMPDRESYNEYSKARSEVRDSAAATAGAGEFQIYSFRLGKGSDSEIITLRSTGLAIESPEYRQMIEDLMIKTFEIRLYVTL